MDTTLENTQVLHLVQALAGAVSRNFRRVTLESPSAQIVRLRFLLERESDDDREEIRDIAFEFEALQDAPIQLDVHIVVDDRSIEDVALPGRVVYGRRE